MTPRCPNCHALTPRSPGSIARAVVLGLAWAVAMGLVFGAAVIGPFIMAILPVLLLAGVGVVTAAHEFAYGDRLCESCGRAYFVDGARVESEHVEIESKVGAPALAA